MDTCVKKNQVFQLLLCLNISEVRACQVIHYISQLKKDAPIVVYMV